MSDRGARSLRVCFIGDSMVQGTGDPECLGWPGRICAAALRDGIDLTCYNLGVRRDTSADVAARWSREARARLPRGSDGRLVFSFGLNDLVYEAGAARVPLDASAANLRAILSEARQSYPVLMVGPPPMLDEQGRRLPVAELSRRYAEVCGTLGVPYRDTAGALERTGTFLREAIAYDGAHPRAAGYAELAALVQGWDAWQAWLR